MSWERDGRHSYLPRCSDHPGGSGGGIAIGTNGGADIVLATFE